MRILYILAPFILLFNFQVLASEDTCLEIEDSFNKNQCFEEKVRTYNQIMEHNYQESLSASEMDTSLVAAIELSQLNWLAYRKSQCYSESGFFGTSGIPMEHLCNIRLAKLRAHELWSSFLSAKHLEPEK